MKQCISIISWISISCLLILGSCATQRSSSSVDTTSLADLSSLSQQDLKSERLFTSKIRLDALKETALSLGAQGGLAWKASAINNMLAASDKQLSQVFNFTGLILDNHVLPPVMQESQQSLQLDDPNTIRLADHTYKILKQARFVTTAPIWQDYLWMNYSKPELPDSTLLPRSSEERALWIKYIHIGWRNGVAQAQSIYADNLARLERDFKGMVLYRKLLAKNMVSKPFVAKTNLGITSDGGQMRISDQVLRITATPTLNTNVKQWKPALVKVTP